MQFVAKVYRLGKSGRLAIMLPKDVIVEVGEWEVEMREKQGVEVPVEPSATPLEVNVQEETPAQSPQIN